MQPLMTARLAAPTAAVSALLLFLAIGTAGYVRDLQSNQARLLKDNVASVTNAQELEISIREVRTQLVRYMVSADGDQLKPIPDLKQRADAAFHEVERTAYTVREKELIEKIRTGYDRFFAEFESYRKTPAQPETFFAIYQLIDNLLKEQILEATHEFLEINEKALLQTSQENADMSENVMIGIYGLGIFGSLGGLLGGWTIAATVRRRIQKTEDTIRQTADQLSQAVPIDSRPTQPETEQTDTLQQFSDSVTLVLNRLRQSERDALRAEQLAWVGQMAAGIAHEIRNPLMAIKLLVQATASPFSGSPFRSRDLEVLEEEIIRMEQIISLFLDFARPPRPEKSLVDLSQLLKSAIESIRSRAELQNVTLNLELPIDVIQLMADGNQLRQVLYNLLFNALDVLPQGGEIRIWANPEASQNPPIVEFGVEDNGPGLAPGLESRIFEPFISTKETGLGLGLSITRRIIESHQGTIAADRGKLGGASFVVRLPAGEIESPAPVPALAAIAE